MRWYRSNEPDLWAEPEPPFRDDRLRELVDGLPLDSRWMIERVYFGGASVTVAAKEITMSFDQGQRALKRGLGALRGELSKED